MCCVVLSRFSHVRLFATVWIVSHLAPLSMGFSRKDYWRGLPYRPPGDVPIQGSDLHFMSAAVTGGFFTTVQFPSC